MYYASDIPKFKHIHQKYKREQIFEGEVYIERNTEIERENRILLEKMHNIFRKTSRPMSKPNKSSLNNTFRKKLEDQISSENKNLYKRLKNKYSNYSRKQYADQRRLVEDRITMIRHLGSKSKSTDRQKVPKKSPILLDIRNLVFKKPIYVTNRGILVEVYKYSENVRILAIDGYNADVFRLIISHEDAAEIVGEDEDWERLIDSLDIEGDCLILKI